MLLWNLFSLLKIINNSNTEYCKYCYLHANSILCILLWDVSGASVDQLSDFYCLIIVFPLLLRKERQMDHMIAWSWTVHRVCIFNHFLTNINKNQPCTARRSISCLPGGSEPVLLCIARLCICNVISRGAVSPVAWTSYPAVSNSASSILAIVARFRSHLKKHFNYMLEISWEVFVYKLDKQPGVHTELYKLSVKYEHGLIIKSSY